MWEGKAKGLRVVENSMTQLKNGDWGLTPKLGSFNMNGTWGGVLGGVINKQFDMSMSSWTWLKCLSFSSWTL